MSWTNMLCVWRLCTWLHLNNYNIPSCWIQTKEVRLSCIMRGWTMMGDGWPFFEQPSDTLWWMQMTTLQFSRTNKWTELQIDTHRVNKSSKTISKTELHNSCIRIWILVYQNMWHRNIISISVWLLQLKQSGACHDIMSSIP